MSYRVNPRVGRVLTPPIAEVAGWVRGRTFDDHRPLLDVAQAVPSYGPAWELRAHIARAVEQPATAFYTDILGITDLRRALAEHMSAEYGARVQAEQTAITAGCNQAFCAVISALAQPDDEVMLALPYYFNHQMWLEMQGIRPVLLPFHPERGGTPDPGEAAQRITGRTRAIVLITPNNPTGAVYPAGLIDDFFALARRHGLALVIDETYKDFRDPAPAADAGTPAHDLFRHPDWDQTFVQLYSFSKAYSLTGYRVGSVIAGRRLLDEVAKILDCIAICAPHIGQSAALYGLRHLEAWRITKSASMAQRMQALQEAFGDNRLRYELAVKGAYFAYVRHPFRGHGAVQVARRLAEEYAVLCLPGSAFGPGQEEYLRFAFANLETGRLPDLVQRLVASQA